MEKEKSKILIKRELIDFNPDNSRVITKFFTPGSENRIMNIISRVLALPPSKISKILDDTIKRFKDRHRDIKRVFKDNFDKINTSKDLTMLSLEQKLLIGSYFTMEYSIEAAALFNPSIVPAPNQNSTTTDELNVIISFRAVGEGHISSIVFRNGFINKNGDLKVNVKSDLVEKAKVTPNYTYNKESFVSKLIEIDSYDFVKDIFDNLLDEFTNDELEESIERFKKNKSKKKKKLGQTSPRYIQAIEILEWLANSTYNIEFNKDLPLASRVIFPSSINDRKGLEDARFVCFIDNLQITYYATYTAYNGVAILPQLIETEDFCNFKISTLNGSGSQNKGMALFPEKINNKYAMISRNDNENLYIMYSDNIRFWEDPKLLKEPEVYWEFFQIGNSGPPLKTKKGWLLLTHGVGPVRTYCIGIILLDLKNPGKVIAVLEEPLIMPNEDEREGYVPNVVYSCGAIIHKNNLIVPYAMSDTRSGIAKFNLDQIFENMKKNK